MSKKFRPDVMDSPSQRRYLALAPWVAAALLSSSCSLTPGAIADTVAQGTGRLMIRNLASVASIINKDTNCGFASPAVLANPTMSGTVGSVGSLTWTVTDCTFDGGDGFVFSTDCNGVTKTASGKFKISATKTVTGTLTGVATSPLIPDSANAFSADLTSLEFDGFKVVASDSESWMEIKSGTATGKLERLLAVLESNGVCGFATDNTRLTNISVKDAKVHISSATSETDATVDQANLTAYAGQFLDKENELTGDLTITSQVRLKKPLPAPPFPPSRKATITLPVKGETTDLDPSYDHDKFISTYSCDATMHKPQSYTCADLTPALADGAARLTAKSFGAIAGLLDKNTTCGFSSPTAQVDTTGAVGGTGSVSIHVQNCMIAVPANTLLPADCSGAQTKVGGTVMVTGTKLINGRLTGNAASPVVPTTDSPATITLTITAQDFTVGSSTSVSALRLKSGTLAGTLQPRVALASDTGACSITMPVARLSALTYTNAQIQLTSTSGTFDLAVGTSTLNATAGTWDADSNKLAGTLRIGMTDHTVPADGLGLDPTFTQATFDAAWTCTPNLVMPVNNSCGFTTPLAQGIARLTPRTLGAVLSLINADTTCGFSSAGPTVGLSGTVGGPGVFTQTIAADAACDINLGLEHPISTDCNGSESRVGGGHIKVSGTKTVTGFLTGNQLAPVVPNNGAPAVFDLVVEVVPETPAKPFLVRSSTSTSSLALVSGKLAAKMTPQTALDPTTGACSIASPVITFENITYTDAQVRLNSDGKLFDQAVSTSDLTAQNGTLGAVSNQLTGTLTMNGTAYNIPVPGSDNKLDPTFTQAAFDAAWQCAPPGGVAPIVPTSAAQCSFQGPLGQGVARLTPRTMGVIASLLNANGTCGFSAPSVLATAVPTGMVGSPGSLQFVVPEGTPCEIGFTAEQQVSEDCSGNRTYVTGKVMVSGTKTVGGWITGDTLNPAYTPVIPASRDAATFNLKVTFSEAFTVRTAACPAGVCLPSVNTLTASSGTLEGQVQPRLAMDPTTGACSISTPVTTFTDLKWTNAAVSLNAAGKRFDLTAADSQLQAQNGTKDAVSNDLHGTLTLGTNAITIPVNPADTRLDPEFNQAAFDATFACAPPMGVAPIIPSSDAQCSFVGALAQGTSRLTPRNLGAVVGLMEAATTACGFKSAAVAGTPTFGAGSVVGDETDVTFTLDATNGCSVTLPAATALSPDCSGVNNTVGGTVVVRGTKKVHGFRTGDPLSPVVPTSRDAVTFDLTATFTDFTVGSSNSTKALTIKDGTVAFTLQPRTALDPTTGACSISTPVVTFSNITYGNNAHVRLADGGKKFDLVVAASSLNAQSGNKEGTTPVTNRLTGSITAMGAPITIPISADDRLDPAYDQAAFDAGFACLPGTIPATDVACSFRRTLANGVARLLVKNVGVATSLMDKNTTCGYASAATGGVAVSTNPSPVPAGSAGVLTLTAATPCANTTLPASIPACDGSLTNVEGTFTAAGTKAVSGVGTGSPASPVAPVTRTAATFTHTSLDFASFAAFDPASGSKLKLVGPVSAVVKPVAAESSANAGIYSVSTPVAQFESINATAVHATLVNGPKTFNVVIDTSDVTAFNGSYNDQGTQHFNELGGSITIDGQAITLPGNPSDVGLVPGSVGYSQATFDAAYACTPGMVAVVPAN